MRCAILTNKVTPYKTLLFDALATRGLDLAVVFLALADHLHPWAVDRARLRFRNVVLDEPGRGRVAWRRVPAAWRALARLDPRLVVIGGYACPEYWAALVWARRRRRPAVLLHESHLADRRVRPAREALKRAFVRRCQGALVDGSRHAAYVQRLGMPRERVFVKLGPGPIDAGAWRAAVDRWRPRPDPGRRAFLYVGRLSPEKNVLALVDAWAAVRARHAAWDLLLVGDGPERPAIEAAVGRHGLPGVEMPGFRQTDELPRWYARADVLVLPSLWEPWGYVANEAMAAGLPAIVSDRCGSVPDLVEHGVSGWTFDPGDPAALERMLLDVADGKHDLGAMGPAAWARVQGFGPAQAAEAVALGLDRIEALAST